MSKFLPLGRVFQDIRFALRTMVIHAEFSAVVVLTLAMGIGVNTAIFSLVNGVLLRPLSFDRPNELVKALNRSLPKGGYVALRERLQRLDVACYAHESGFNLTNNGETVRVVADGISSNLFSVLGVKPILGRDFTREDELPGRREVIIGYNLWQSQFGGDRGIIGRNVMLDDVGHEVVGVMPQGFNFPGSSQIWGAFDVNPSADDFWGWGYNVIGRMRPGADLAAVRAEFKGVFPQVVSTFPFAVDPHLVPEADVSLLQQYQVAGVQKMLLMLLAAVTVILLVACVVDRPAERDGGALRAGRQPRTNHVAVAHRERDPGSGRRSARAGAGLDQPWISEEHDARGHASACRGRHRPACARIFNHSFFRRRPDFRHASGGSCIAPGY